MSGLCRVRGVGCVPMPNATASAWSAAAREVFAERGLDASTNEIARRAGVGVATLFRRFPTRDDLVGAAFADKMRAYAAAIDDALAESGSVARLLRFH